MAKFCPASPRTLPKRGGVGGQAKFLRPHTQAATPNHLGTPAQGDSTQIHDTEQIIYEIVIIIIIIATINGSVPVLNYLVEYLLLLIV